MNSPRKDAVMKINRPRNPEKNNITIVRKARTIIERSW